MADDNDNLAAMLTNLLGAELLIIMTNVDGILNADPRDNPAAKRIWTTTWATSFCPAPDG